jgi:hypothetical protein
MKLNLKVTYDDGSTMSVKIGMVDFVAYERENNKSIQEYFNNWNVSDTCFLAWHSLSRTDKDVPEFMDWVANVDEITTADIEEDPVPLESSPTTSS